MLVELVVVNLVIVERAALQIGGGLVVISGETGAGKSLLLDAIDLVSGARARAGLVGRWGPHADVTAVFEVDPGRATLLEQACGIAPVDGQYLLRRRIAEGGRSQAWINDVPVTVTALRAGADLLIDLHSQHEPIRLAEPAVQLGLLDAYGGHEALARDYREAHDRVQLVSQTLAELERVAQAGDRELDFLQFQAKQFDDLDPRPGEYLLLSERQHFLSQAGHWRDLAGEGVQRLVEGDRALAQEVGRWARKLEQAPDPQVREAAAACRQAAELLGEAGTALAALADRADLDPAELERVETRLDAWNTLLRKFGPEEADLLAARERIQAQITELSSRDGRRQDLEQELVQMRSRRHELGTRLADVRQAAFDRLAAASAECLAELGMPKAALHLRDEPGEPGRLGLRQQEILVTTNPGLPPGSIRAIASGGEAARLMLALSTALADADRIPVMVFDEVDSGVGGRLGSAIGAHLARLGRGRTVIAVTHTPQVAALGDRQYQVRKLQGEDSTTVQVEELIGDRRVLEITEMLGGGSAARHQAETLLNSGSSKQADRRPVDPRPIGSRRAAR